MFYSSVTAFLGFRAHRHEGKITGLAAYGDPDRCYHHFVPCLKLADNKRSLASDLCKSSWIGELVRVGRVFSGRYYRKAIMNAYDQHYRTHLAAISREDIAAAAQKRLEDVFVELLAPIIKETALEKVALAGGVFGNVKLNQRIFEIEGVREIFVHPNMGDGGNALGSALHTYMAYKDSGPKVGASPARIEDVYFGPEYADPAIEEDLKRHDLVYRRCENIEALVADKLADGQVVGRFNGRMEYGPRALGNRSILANPADASINATLNERLRRTEFMPFAPSVLAEDAQTYFDISDGNLHATRFMTITCRVRPDKRAAIPAVCHIDGTARPNVVHRTTNESYHRILKEFKQRTGFGVIVNTSFNVHEEPIVCTPADACKALQHNAVDTLAIGNFAADRARPNGGI
jgi:carbamoyltransferase